RIVDTPEITAMDFVAMTLQQKAHSVVDDTIRTRNTHEMGYRKTVNRPRRIVNLPYASCAAFRPIRAALLVQREEAAGGIEACGMEKIEKADRLIKQPAPVTNALRKASAFDAHPSRLALPMIHPD